jgi:speckle-type POZ protein
VKIKVGGETFPAHRWVLEARSPVLKADLSLAPMADGTTAELRVDDMDAEVFKTLLRFMYTDSPPLLEAAPAAERLLVAADRYQLEKLKNICEEALCQHIDMSSVAATLALAERHHCSVLTAACMQFFSFRNLEAFVAADGFKQLKTAGCPSHLFDLVANKMP